MAVSLREKVDLWKEYYKCNRIDELFRNIATYDLNQLDQHPIRYIPNAREGWMEELMPLLEWYLTTGKNLKWS